MKKTKALCELLLCLNFVYYIQIQSSVPTLLADTRVIEKAKKKVSKIVGVVNLDV